jgi:hypothetical protein
VGSDLYKRVKKKKYKVSTISLLDMLIKHNAPKKIDYLSIDTEGSEYEILKNFDFDAYNVKSTVEINNNKERQESIFELLTRNNSIRKYIGISGPDDWYVKKYPGTSCTG